MVFERTVDPGPAEQLAKDHARVRREFWAKIKKVAAKLPFAEDLLAAYYCAFDRADAAPCAGGADRRAGLFHPAVRFHSDVMPVLGFTDDAAVLATTIRLVASHILPDHRAAAKMRRRGCGERVRRRETRRRK